MDADEVIVLLRESGKYHDHDRLYLSLMHNILPSFGDRLTWHIDEEDGLATYEVVERYCSRLIIDNFGNEGSYWVLVVEQIHNEALERFDIAMRQIHSEEYQRRQPKGGGAEVERLGEWKRETLDRNNRDPEYWTKERKQILQKEREARLAAIAAGEEPAD